MALPVIMIEHYQVADFKPFLTSHPLLQTVLSNFYPRPGPIQLTRLSLPCGDKHSPRATFAIDIANGSSLDPSDDPAPGIPIAIIVPGIESTADHVITRRLLHALTRRNFKVVLLNYRTCGEIKTVRLYHMGFQDDLKTLLRHIAAYSQSNKSNKHSSPTPVYLCGFSIGSNIVCNFLGQHGSKAMTDYNVVAAGAVAVPFRTSQIATTLETGWK